MIGWQEHIVSVPEWIARHDPAHRARQVTEQVQAPAAVVLPIQTPARGDNTPERPRPLADLPRL